MLAGPIVQALAIYPQLDLKNGLQQVLQQTTIADACCVYEGIRLVSPAGMGQREDHDVSEAPQIDLLQAMRLASTHDMVARQYVDGYEIIFSQVLPLYRELIARWERPAWALTAVYLYWLSTFPDSHIARKYGAETAASVQQASKVHYKALLAMENPKHSLPELLAWDQALKQQKLNPGTSADLTVITAMCAALTG